MQVVETVRGRVAADQIGVVLPHEHLFIDLIANFGTQLLAFDFQLADLELATMEAGLFKDAGGGCITDVTPNAALGRNPTGLLTIANELDLHVIMGCGWYRGSWYTPEIDTTSAAGLAESLIREIVEGVGNTAIRPGVIGEIGADRHYLTAAEERVLRSVARAHKATERPITLHARASRVGHTQLDVLEEEGVDLRRVIVGHCDTLPDPAYHKAIAERGAWVEFDTIRGPHEDVLRKRIWLISQAIEMKYIDQVLVSHDVCAMSHLHARGGSGYDFILSQFMPRLASEGFGQDLRELLLRINPQKALSFDGSAP